MNKNKIIVALVLAIVALTTYGAIYLLPQKQVVSNSVVTSTSQVSLTSLSSSSSSNLFANWEQYIDTKDKFSFSYPKDYALDLSNAEIPVLGQNISWNVSSSSVCLGDCPTSDVSKTVTLGENTFQRISGVIGAVGGNVPQSYVNYQIKLNDGKYLVFTVYELPVNLNVDDYNLLRNVGEVSVDTISQLELILSTLKL